jgi:hypothetical protein
MQTARLILVPSQYLIVILMLILALLSGNAADVHLVQGPYEYYHYMQVGEEEAGGSNRMESLWPWILGAIACRILRRVLVCVWKAGVKQAGQLIALEPTITWASVACTT